MTATRFANPATSHRRVLTARSHAAAAFGLVFAILLTACGGDKPAGPTGPDAPTVASVAVSPGADTLLSFGETIQMSASATDASGNTVGGQTFAWTSSDPNVASVSSSGLVTAEADGQVTITASVSGVSGTANVSVAQQVASVTVTPTSMSLSAVGQTVNFTAEARDANNNVVTGVATVWLSSDHNVATINSAGAALATGSGTAVITGAVRGVPGTAVLSVNQTPARLGFRKQPGGAVAGDAMSVFEVEIRDANGALVGNAANSVTLQIATNPSSGSLGGTVTVAAVNGVAQFDAATIDAVGSGYTIQATSGTLTNITSAPFDVVHPTIVVTPGDLNLFIAPGDIVQYQAIAVNPFTGAVSSPGVTWTVDNQTVATIDEDRGVLEALANGTANVTATTTSGASGSTTFTSAIVILTEVRKFPFSIPFRVMQVTWDGTSYYLSNGGGAGSGQIQRLDAAGTVQQTVSINMDMRGMFYRPADGKFYAKNFGLDWFEVDPNAGTFSSVLLGIFSQSQTKPAISDGGTRIYEQDAGLVRILDFTTGAQVGVLTGFQFGAFPGQHVVQTDGGHLVSMDETGNIFMYDLQGRLISSFQLPNAVTAQSIWSLSFANGLLWVSDTGTGTGTLFAYRLDKQ